MRYERMRENNNTTNGQESTMILILMMMISFSSFLLFSLHQTATQQHCPPQARGHTTCLLLQNSWRVQQNGLATILLPFSRCRGLLGRKSRPRRRSLGTDAQLPRGNLYAIGHAGHKGKCRAGSWGLDGGGTTDWE